MTAKGVFVVDAESGVPLFAHDADAPLPPASLTKIAAALVVLEWNQLDTMIEILPEDLVPPEESQVGLVAGDVLSARDLLFGALIPSGNDATLALARTVGAQDLGEGATSDEAVARFVERMNETALKLGATNSEFLYPTGVDRDGHVMSARDVATLSVAGLANPLFAEIVSTATITLPSQVKPEGYVVYTTNDLLVEGIANGVKTGSTPQAGGCLSASFLIGPAQVVAAVLGSEMVESEEGLTDYSARFADTRTLMAAAEQDYVWLDLLAPETLAGLTEELSVWGVAPPAELRAPVPVTDAKKVRYRLQLGPPQAAGDPSGELQVYVGDALLLTRPTISAS